MIPRNHYVESKRNELKETPRKSIWEVDEGGSHGKDS